MFWTFWQVKSSQTKESAPLKWWLFYNGVSLFNTIIKNVHNSSDQRWYWNNFIRQREVQKLGITQWPRDLPWCCNSIKKNGEKQVNLFFYYLFIYNFNGLWDDKSLPMKIINIIVILIFGCLLILRIYPGFK